MLAEFSTRNLLLDVCQPCYSQLFKTEFLLIGLLGNNFSKLTAFVSTPVIQLATLHGFIFDEHLSFTEHINALCKSCYSYIRQLRCIHSYLDFKTASTITTSIIHSKLDYCNSLYCNRCNSQQKCLYIPGIQNSCACAVVKAFKFSHAYSIFKSLQWLTN